MLPTEEVPFAAVGRSWRARRARAEDVLLDVARCGRPADAVLAASAAHLAREQQIGGYEAEAEANAMLDASRNRLGVLLGMPGAQVEFLDSGTNAMAALLRAWPWRGGMRVGIPASEFASTRMALDRIARREAIELVTLPEDLWGRIRLDDAAALMREPMGLDLLVLSHVPSQRGIVQPIEALGEIAAATRTAIVLDVCQSLGHVPVPDVGAGAAVGTARKWLHGPRGVGFVALAPRLGDHLDAWPTLQTHRFTAMGYERAEETPLLETAEAAVASRVGLAAAVAEHDAIGHESILDHLRQVGRLTRLCLADVEPWRLREPVEEPTALITLDPPSQRELGQALTALRRVGIRAGHVPCGRSRDHHTAVLRIAPEPSADLGWIKMVVRVLESASRAG